MITNFSKEKCLYVLYDSITNSVFQSQVLFPLIKRLESNKNLEIILISFERNQIAQSHLDSLPSHTRLCIYIQERLPFLGRWSLYPLISFCKKIMYKHSITSLCARGPFAGYIAHYANPWLPLCIQARGLGAEEFKFSSRHQSSSLFKKIYNRIFYSRLHALERTVYSLQRSQFSIEAVSTALCEYLKTAFGTPEHYLSIAQHDIPALLSHEEKKQWRKTIRSHLGIDEATFVYCYSGSARPWQCIDEMIFYFKNDRKKHSSSLFLILTCDENVFDVAMKNYNLSSDDYRIMNIAQNELYYYLSAADVGLLFRKKDIINWVARPTKMLEYQAAHLPIIHNNTVQILSGN